MGVRGKLVLKTDYMAQKWNLDQPHTIH